jgi:uncharacterized protein
MFWDSSAIVPVLVPEARSAMMAALLQDAPVLAAWWATPVECQSAVYRRQREGGVPRPIVEQALQRLKGLVEDADFVAPTNRLRERAGRLLASHPLRAADALQLAAALVWCDDRPENEPFVSLDERLREAALREGFAILPR